MSKTIIRKAKEEDAEQLLEIYAPYVTDTAITFEYEVPTIDEFRQRIKNTLKKYPYLVAEDENGSLMGYAYAGAFKGRAAYDWAVETSIYVKMGERKKGIGKALYEETEKRLKQLGILNMNACTTWLETPNSYITHDSPDFHKHLGFVQCAHFHKCGYKFGRWFDILWFEKMLGEHEEKQ